MRLDVALEFSIACADQNSLNLDGSDMYEQIVSSHNE